LESDYFVKLPLNPVLTFLANRAENLSDAMVRAMIKRLVPDADPQSLIAKLYGAQGE